MGRSWTTVDVRYFQGHLRNGLGLPDGNSCAKWTMGVITDPTGAQVGPAAPYDSSQYGRHWTGGLPEIAFQQSPELSVRVLASGRMDPAC